jgi:Ca-activated chloride channel family protein
MNADIRLDHKLLSVDAEHDVHAMLELSVPELPGDAARPPLRLALVLDRSGSMAGAKLETAKRCAAWLVGRLRPADELALVAYDHEVTLVSPLSTVQRERVTAAIAGIYAGGQTNLSGGWLRGLEQLRGGRGKVLLLSDGLANVGITEPARLVALAHGAGREGIGTSTIGFGEGFDEDLLTGIADAGGGNAHYAETPDAAPAIFADELEGLTRLAAQNVTLEIRPALEVEMLGVLNEYPHEPVAGGVRVELGDAYAGETRRVVFGLHIPRLGELGVARVAELVLGYVAVGDEIAEHTLTVPVVANLVSADEAAAAELDAEVREEVRVLEQARAQNEAIRLADAGDFDAARGVLHAAGLPAPDAYDATSRKHLLYGARAAQRQRRRH